MLGRRNDVRVILLGDSGVGKTSFVRRLPGCNRELDMPTLAPAYFSLHIHISKGRKQPIALWDTAGQERFRGMMPMYFRDCNVALLIYDVNDRYSFVGAARWLKELRKYQPKPHTVVFIGNKTDLPDRKVPEAEGRAFARRHGLFFCEISILRSDTLAVHRILRESVRNFVLKRDQRTGKEWESDLTSRLIVLGEKESTACCASNYASFSQL